jgi:hypothetical protein
MATAQQVSMVLPLVDDSRGPRTTTTQGTVVNADDKASQLPTPPKDTDTTVRATDTEEDPQVELARFTTGQVSQHKTVQDLWIIIDGST